MPAYSVNEIIELAVQIEHNGFAFYNEALKRKGLDTKSVELLTLLRDQELDHERTFLTLRDDHDLKNLELSQDWELVSSYLKTIVKSRIFASETSAIRRANRAKDVTNLIDFAVQFEKDTLLFFYTIKVSLHNPKAQSAIARIIREEFSHILKLNYYKASLIK